MRKLVCATVVIGITLLMGCSGAAREHLKHWLFEVPEPSANAADKAAAPQDRLLGASPSEPVYASTHAPYTTRECTACHDRSRSMEVPDDLTEWCRICHPRFFSSEVGHSPVEEGECAECHEAHRAEKRRLLKQSVYDTCIECHEEDELSEEAHEVDNVEDCTACHDAHFGTGALLRPGSAAESPQSD